MSGLFAYAKVASASKPTAAAELRKAAAAAGHAVLPDNTVIESVAGLVTVSARPAWRGLLDRMYEGDVLVVPAMSDLGSDVKEVCATVRRLAALGLRVHCLGLGQGRLDLASQAGRPTMEVLAAVAAFQQGAQAENERSTPGVGRTVLSSPRKGRPQSLNTAQRAEAHRLLAEGTSVVQIARQLQTSRQTIMRMRARDQMQSVSKSRPLDKRSR